MSGVLNERVAPHGWIRSRGRVTEWRAPIAMRVPLARAAWVRLDRVGIVVMASRVGVRARAGVRA